jgi:hypothetical protein
MTIFKWLLNKIVNNYSNSVALDGNPEPDIGVTSEYHKEMYWVNYCSLRT